MPTVPEAMRSSLMADIDRLEHVLRPSDFHSAAMIIGRLSNSLPSGTNSKLTGEEADQQVMDYIEALQNMPADLLETARYRVMHTSIYFPPPAKLYAAVQREIDERRDMLAAARHLVWKMDQAQ